MAAFGTSHSGWRAFTKGLIVKHNLRFDVNRRLFEAEEQDLFADLQSLPRLVKNLFEDIGMKLNLIGICNLIRVIDSIP